MKRMIIMLTAMLAVSTWVLAAERRSGSVEPAVSMEQAIEVAKKEVPGKVILSVLTGEMYTIRIRTADRAAVTVRIDASTGAVVRNAEVLQPGDGSRVNDKGMHRDRKENGGFTKPGKSKGFKKGFGENEGDEEDDD